MKFIDKLQAVNNRIIKNTVVGLETEHDSVCSKVD
jgi:hypothetical protein